MRPSLEKIQLLNQGKVEARNLMEALSVDFTVLLFHVLPEFKTPEIPSKLGITKKMQLLSSELYRNYGMTVFDIFKTHTSDSIRGLACYLLGTHSLKFEQKLNMIQSLADDSNSGVREWAWIALRPDCISDPQHAVSCLEAWACHSSQNIRRYACEITRPRGVWCSHIKDFKQDPQPGLRILEHLKDDSSKYVQLSVGNWLNDAGKDNPRWVKELCSRWMTESDSLNTQKICKRALRNLKK